MYLNSEEFGQIAEYLDQKLGRDATDEEVLAYIEELESKQYDIFEAEVKGE